MLVKLGIPEQFIAHPEAWLCLSGDQAFQELLQTPLRTLLVQGDALEALNELRIPVLDDHAGVLKGTALLEVVSYRDVSKPLPLAKELELTGEELQPQYLATRTFKLLLTDGTDRTFVAMEYEPCPALDQVRLGAKLQIKDCSYLHGVLMLNSKCARLLGGPTNLWNDDPPDT